MSSLLMTATDVFQAIAQATTPPSSAASKDSSFSQLLLYLGGFAGVVTAIGAIAKLKPDANSQSVTQAQGAASEWIKIANERKGELRVAEYEAAWWRTRASTLEVVMRANNITIPEPPAFNPPVDPPSPPGS